MANPDFTEGGLSATATFADPVFRLTQQSHDLQRELYTRLNPHKLQLDQIEENGAYTGPAGWSLSMRFLGVPSPSFGQGRRIRIELVNRYARHLK